MGEVAGDLVQIEPMLPDEARRQIARRARSPSTRIAGELARELDLLSPRCRVMRRCPMMPQATGELTGGIGSVTLRCHAAWWATVSSTAMPAAASSGPGAASTLTTAAEELATASERLHATTLAARPANQVRPAPPPLPSSREVLAEFLRFNAVFFGNGTDFRVAGVDRSQTRPIGPACARHRRHHPDHRLH